MDREQRYHYQIKSSTSNPTRPIVSCPVQSGSHISKHLPAESINKWGSQLDHSMSTFDAPRDNRQACARNVLTTIMAN
jgi:hypothetical protein